MVRDSSRWYGFVSDFGNNNIDRLVFERDCGVSEEFSLEFEPENVLFFETGTFDVSLTAFNERGIGIETIRSIVVSNDIAPDIDFEIGESRCIDNLVDFTSITSSSEISSYSWDFDGDGIEDSSDPNPDFQYTISGSYQVSLSVSSDNGCTNRISREITIFPVPNDPVFEITGNVFCQNTEIEFNNLSINEEFGDGLTYLWDFNGEGTSTDFNPTFSFESAGTKIVSLQAIIPGCTTNLVVQEVFINEGPIVDFAFDEVCEGTQTSFAGFTVGEEIMNYSWDFGDGFTSNIQNPQHLFAGNGSFTVTLTGQNTLGCTSSVTKEIRVGQVPIPRFEIVDEDVACSSNELQFRDVTNSTIANIINRTWTVEGFDPTTEESPVFVFDEPGDYQVNFRIENDFGCIASTDSVITVLASPEAIIGVSKGCLNSETVFTDLTEVNVLSRFWRVNGAESTEESITVEFDSPGTYEVLLEVTGENFCVIDTVMNITIDPLPEIDFENSTPCQIDQIRFEDTSLVFGDPIESRNWDFGDGTFANGEVVFHNYGEAGTYLVSLEIITANLCTTSITKSVVVAESPIAGFSINQDFGIPPFNVQATDQSSGAVSINWFLNDQFLVVNDDLNPIIPITENGLFVLKQVIINENMCTDSLETQILSGTPNYDLVLTDFNVIEDEGNSTFIISMRNDSNLPISGFDIEMTLQNDFVFRERFEGILRQGEETVYALNTTLPLGQPNTDFVCINLRTPFEEFPDINQSNNEDCRSISNRIEISEAFPNPTRDIARVKIVLPNPQSFSMQLIDLTGNVIRNLVYDESEDELINLSIDLSALNSGMYLVVFTMDDRTEMRRVLKL